MSRSGARVDLRTPAGQRLYRGGRVVADVVFAAVEHGVAVPLEPSGIPGHTGVVKRRSPGQILLAAAVLPLVVLIGLQSAWAAFACRVDGKVRDACCCPKPDRQEARERAPDHAPIVSAECCCSVEVHAATPGPSAQAAEQITFDHLISAVVAVTDVPRATIVIRSWRPEITAPPPRVTGFLAKRAILR